MRRSWRISAVCLLAAILVSLPALAEHTRFWRTTNYADFERGTAESVALWSDGKLVPAAKFGHFSDPNLAYLWALRTDSKGRLYASGGSNARVFRFDKQGKATTVFQSSELTAQAMVFDAHDDLYVGTSPDGKVYKVTPDGKSSVFFDPKTKYIWSLAIDRHGVLYVGTGDKGEIYAVTPDGKSALFYKSDERHIRALALDDKGDLIAGTDPSGLVIRIPIEHGAAAAPPKAGPAFVVYETAGQEITALNFGRRGDLYVASIGSKHGQASATISAPTGTTFVFSAAPTGAAEAQSAAEGKPEPQGTTPQTAVLTGIEPTPGGSHVYRIAPDGSPKLLWESRSDLVYSLGLSQAGKLLLGTGNSGDVIELEGDEIFSKIAETASGQVTGFASGPDGRVYLCTANPGKVFTLGPGIASEGTFTSAPFDARIFSKWGRLNWWGEGAEDGHVTFYARSGNTSNPDKNWSKWYGPYTAPQSEPVGCPPARFVQWKAVFHPAAGTVPSLSWISLAYLPKNVAPAIDDVVMEDPGIRVRMMQIPQMQGTESMRPVRLRMPHTGQAGPNRLVAPESIPSGATHFVPPPQGFREKGWQSVLWSAHDDNGDHLEYSVYYRGEKEHTWKLLKSGLRDPYYSWDTTTMPDGAYYIKIVSSDSPSNPPAQALDDTRVGPRFVVDNTPPAISGLEARTATDDATIVFSAKDPSSPLARAEYSIDAGPWTLVRPVGQLSDAPSESYNLQLKNLSPGEHTISVRVFDLYENSGIAKITFNVTAPARR
jgi:sugar lactone lactonase YvrE